MAKGIAAKLIAQRLHQGGGGNTRMGGEGALLHGGTAGMPKAKRERLENERIRKHNEEVRSGKEKGKEWQ